MTKEEADNALRDAIFNVASAYGLVDEGELMNDFAVIVHWQQVTMEEGDEASRYTTHYSGRTVPHHIAKGLFQTGVDINRWNTKE